MFPEQSIPHISFEWVLDVERQNDSQNTPAKAKIQIIFLLSPLQSNYLKAVSLKDDRNAYFDRFQGLSHKVTSKWNEIRPFQFSGSQCTYFTQGKNVAGPDLNNIEGNKDKETFHLPMCSLLSGFGEPQESSLKISLPLFFAVIVCQENNMWQLKYSADTAERSG